MDDEQHYIDERRQANMRAAQWEGYIDAIQGGRVYGWAMDGTDKSNRLKVEIYHGSNLLDCVTADRFREDLVDYGDGSGRHAFVFTLPKEIWSANSNEFHARFEGTDLPLLKNTKLIPKLEDDTEIIEDASYEDIDDRAVIDLERLAERVEALERSTIALGRLFDPRERTIRTASEDAAEAVREVGEFRRELQAIEPFLIRMDGRIKDIENLADMTPEQKIGKGKVIKITGLILLLIFLVILHFVLISYL